jgi:hypothetical protein
MATMKTTMESGVAMEAAVKSTATVEVIEMVEVVEIRVMEAIGERKSQPAAVRPVGVVAAVVPVGFVPVDIGRLGSGRISVRVAGIGSRRAALDTDYRECAGAKCKPAHALDMVSPGDSSKSGGVVASKRDCLHDGWRRLGKLAETESP